jgi:hypothetical protein
MRRTPAAAELPRVAGRPGSDFNASGQPVASWPKWRAVARIASAAVTARVRAPETEAHNWEPFCLGLLGEALATTGKDE